MTNFCLFHKWRTENIIFHAETQPTRPRVWIMCEIKYCPKCRAEKIRIVDDKGIPTFFGDYN
jgi:hypothetical protein